MVDYKQFLVTWISKNRGLDENQIDIYADIFNSNYIDSIGIFTLLVDIELDFNILLKPEDIIGCSSNTISSLANILLSKQVDL